MIYRLSLFLIVAVVVQSASARDLTDATDNRPNIVFILIDDMGWPDTGCYGNSFHKTPFIDQLAHEGVRFTDFYSAAPVCSATRASIQSGQSPARIGITDFIPGHWRPFERLIVPPIQNALPANIQTPGELLRNSGYKTAYFGKWHLGNGPKNAPRTHGYETTAATLGKQFKPWRGSAEDGPKKIDLLTDQTLYFIETSKDVPFFVTLSHHAVHIRIEARNETVRKYESKLLEANEPTDKKIKTLSHRNPRYAAMIEELDTSIGRILRRLDELNLARNTVVVFASDNGGLKKIFTGIGESVSTNAPLRDEKGTLYEGGIRVPMIVRWPGTADGFTTCSVPTTTTDLLPTFCEIANAPAASQTLDGESLVPLLNSKAKKLKREAIFFHYPHYHHSKPAGAIREGSFKLIEFFESGDTELYDLASDVGEQVNLANQQPELARRLQKKLASWRQTVKARMPVVNEDFDSTRASEWWNRGSKKPLDVEAMRKHYDSKASQNR